jgi:C-terminal processing protease CtpA/Prc
MSREQNTHMKGQHRSLFWSLCSIGVLASFFTGLMVRRHVDGLPVAPSSNAVVMDGYLASRQTGIEITESEYFSQLAGVLEDLYVDGVKDRLQLATGAVRGMVSSLADPDSAYYSKEQMAALTKRLEGQSEGIGVELELEFDPAELRKLQDKARDIDTLMLIPVLRVTAVTPGGPADGAGIKEGDIVTGVNGRSIISSLDVKALRDLQERATKDPTLGSALQKAREAFRLKADNNLPAGQAREKLTTGTSGSLSAELRRGAETLLVRLDKAAISAPPLRKLADGTYQVRFTRGLVEAFLKEGLDKRPATLDLRRSGQGDFGVMKSLIERVGPPGAYGALTTLRGGAPRRLSVAQGLPSGPVYRLKVDQTTRSAAEVFALAMSSRGRAKLDGAKMAGDTVWVDIFASANGEGYTLATGVYRPIAAGGKP